MKMNRLMYIFISAAFGLFVTACTETDEPAANATQKDYILFGQPMIKGNAIIGDFTRGDNGAPLLNSIDKFDVWGYCVPRSAADATKQNDEAAPLDWNRKSNFFTAGSDVFNKVRVTSDGSFTNYKSVSEALRRWHDNEEARYSFIGTSVIEGANNAFSMEVSNSAIADAHGPRLTFTLPTTGNSLATALDYTKQPDALIAYTFDHQRADGKVALYFQHLMIGLRFKFHNYTDEDLVISKVTFKGEFHKQVTIDFSTDKPDFTLTNTNNSTYKGTFTLLSTPQTITPEDGDVYMGTESNPVTLLLLPNRHPVLSPEVGQDKELILGNSKTIEITYKIGDRTEKTYQLPNFELNYIPQENSLHTAHFNFVGDRFVVIFQADNKTQWSDGSDTNIDIQ